VRTGPKIWSGVRIALLIVVLIAGWVGAAFAAPAASAQEELVFCSEIAYPPMESFEGSEAVGADIDIGNEIAARLGRKAVYSNIGFDAIDLPPLSGPIILRVRPTPAASWRSLQRTVGTPLAADSRAHYGVVRDCSPAATPR
jgi:hypothetical protein